MNYFSQFFYRGHSDKKADPRKFWMTISWTIFIIACLFKLALIIIDVIYYLLGDPTKSHELISLGFLGILGGKATLGSGAYIYNKKIMNGNQE